MIFVVWEFLCVCFFVLVEDCDCGVGDWFIMVCFLLFRWGYDSWMVWLDLGKIYCCSWYFDCVFGVELIIFGKLLCCMLVFDVVFFVNMWIRFLGLFVILFCLLLIVIFVVENVILVLSVMLNK